MLHLALVLLAATVAARRPDAASQPTTSGPDATSTAPATTTPPTTTTAPATTTPPVGLDGIALGFNNAEQGVVAADGTALLVVIRSGAVEVVHGAGETVVGVGGSGKLATPAIAAGPQRVAVAWVETGPDGRQVVKAAVSETSGRSFGTAVELGEGGGPSLAAAGDEIVAVWHTGSEGEPGGDVVLARLPAGASDWEAAVPVDDSAAAPLWASVDARGSTLAVAWRDDRSGSYTVWMRVSPDLGVSWEPEVQVVTGASGDPDVCLDPSGTTWLGYHSRGGVYLRSSSEDGGAGFSAPERVGDGWFAHVSCDGDVVAVAWEETTAPPKAPEAEKAAGWATYTKGLEPVARGSQGAPDAVGASVVPTAAGGLDLVWVEPGAAALTGALQRIGLPT